MREFTDERRDKLIETARHMITRKPTSPESEYLRDLVQIALNVLIAEEAGIPLYSHAQSVPVVAEEMTPEKTPGVCLQTSADPLIADGQATANLLRLLADNEIDSDSFAVTSECEAWETETECGIPVTEFALRVAATVDALGEALENAQRMTETQASEISHLEYRLKNVQDAHRYWAERALKNESAVGQLFMAKKRIASLEDAHPERILPENGGNMHTILKYPLGPDSELTMPAGARILSVTVENDEIILWALGDTSAPTESRYITMGHEGVRLENGKYPTLSLFFVQTTIY